MKKRKKTTTVIGLILTLVTICATTIVNTIIAKADVITAESVRAATATVTFDGDINLDNSVDVSDAVLLCRYLIEDRHAIIRHMADPDEDGYPMTSSDLSELLLYISSAGHYTRSIRETPAETTTTTAVTTTKITTTTKAVTTKTTTKITSTSTLKATAKVTTTTKATTTKTTPSATTKATTSTTATSTNNYVKNIEAAANAISIDTVVPPCELEENLVERKNQIFIFEIDEVKYCYTIITSSKNALGTAIANPFLIEAIHIWKYTGTATVPSFTLPNTNGKTFSVNETTYAYNLQPLDVVYTPTKIRSIAEEFGTMYFADIMRYDYNTNGALDSYDLSILLQSYMSHPQNAFWDLNHNAIDRFFANLPKLGHKNVVVYRTNKTVPVEYAFNIPIGDLTDGFEGSTPLCPVQILPMKYEEVIQKSGYQQDFVFFNDENPTNIVWNPFRMKYSFVNKNDRTNWIFESGIYEFVLDDSGHVIRDWIK